MRILIVLFCGLLLFSSCRFVRGERITGNGKSATQERTITDFEGVEVAGHFDVYVTQGAAYSVRLEGDENLLEFIEVRKDGSTLEVGPREGYNLNPQAGLKVHVTAPALHYFSIAGSGNLKGETKITHPNGIEVNLAGSGNANLDLDAPEVNVEVAGSGNVNLRGTTRRFSTEIAGSGEIHAFDLMSEEADIDIAGSGNVEVFASKVLNVSTAGSGDVQYKGNASVSHSKAGSGSVRKAG
ncbi:MAG TPA: head GIN domain-containing protein [Chitinophagaceae bacterium]|jgi:hypothetical protein|nr:head GIN domain-containing protein [Chitinophagaceae bacterium]